MSGGVDSSVAAALLHEQGYDVIGVAMRLAPEQPSFDGGSRRGICCSHEDFEDARRVAEQLDFPFYVVDLRAEFGATVVADFIAEYLKGRTPNPCVLCNREIKFNRLWQRAAAIGAELVATGHYARIEQDSTGRFHLLRARDESKDQSYFLFSLGQLEMSRTLFPLGCYSKSQVRTLARSLGLANADKPESQEICFVPDGKYAEFVSRNAPPGSLRPGRICDTNGQQLGSHDGIHRFTIGQRRGMGISAALPLYVRSIDAETGDVTVAHRDELHAAGLIAGMVRQVHPGIFGHEATSVQVKIRYRHPPLGARVRSISSSRVEVRFDDAGPAVTPGQACVFYREEEVLGGGIIEAALDR
jgi:tRNA-specific 2-thiouridylase